MEIWKDVIGWYGLYHVSSLGRVKRIRKKSVNSKTLKPYLFCKGYLVVTLSNKAFIEKFYIHRLVASHFVPNPKNKTQVNHKDGNKQNNNYLNLEWTSPKENIIHSYENGLAQIGENRAFAKLTEIQAKEIKYSSRLISNREMAKLYSVSASTISGIRIGKKWKHI